MENRNISRRKGIKTTHFHPSHIACRQAEDARNYHQFLAALRCEPVPERAGDYYAAVKLARQQRGLTLDENDLWIAATALALGATLVSRDSDFGGIDGLPVVALE